MLLLIEFASRAILNCLKNRLVIFESVYFAYNDREDQQLNDIHKGKYALLWEEIFLKKELQNTKTFSQTYICHKQRIGSKTIFC